MMGQTVGLRASAAYAHCLEPPNCVSRHHPDSASTARLDTRTAWQNTVITAHRVPHAAGYVVLPKYVASNIHILVVLYPYIHFPILNAEDPFQGVTSAALARSG